MHGRALHTKCGNLGGWGERISLTPNVAWNRWGTIAGGGETLTPGEHQAKIQLQYSLFTCV